MMSVLSKVLGIFGKKDAPKAEPASGGGARKTGNKPVSRSAEKAASRSPAKAGVGRTSATLTADAGDPRAAVKARNKAARKARKRTP
jgi:hypothetical protein